MTHTQPQTYTNKVPCDARLGLVKTKDLKNIGSGAFFGKILLVRIVKNNKIEAYFGAG